MKKSDIMYSLSIEDIQEVAQQELDRALSKREIEQVAEEVGNYIDWFQAIALAIKRVGLEAAK